MKRFNPFNADPSLAVFRCRAETVSLWSNQIQLKHQSVYMYMQSFTFLTVPRRYFHLPPCLCMYRPCVSLFVLLISLFMLMYILLFDMVLLGCVLIVYVAFPAWLSFCILHWNSRWNILLCYCILGYSSMPSWNVLINYLVKCCHEERYCISTLYITTKPTFSVINGIFCF